MPNDVFMGSPDCKTRATMTSYVVWVTLNRYYYDNRTLAVALAVFGLYVFVYICHWLYINVLVKTPLTLMYKHTHTRYISNFWLVWQGSFLVSHYWLNMEDIISSLCVYVIKSDVFFRFASLATNQRWIMYYQIGLTFIVYHCVQVYKA